MIRAALHVWKNLTDDDRVRCLKYTFGPGSANTLAVRLDDGSFMVVSPASGAVDSAIDELAKDGPIKALVAPNAFHHLGQEAWRKRFPDALSYAPLNAFPRLAKKSPNVHYLPIEALMEVAASRVHVLLPEGLKAPDLMFRITNGDDTVWWMGDLFSNSTAADQIWPFRVLARLVGSGPGYRRNTKPGMVYVRDETAWLSSVRDAMTEHPPTVVLPAHGDPVVDDVAARTRRIIDNAR